MKDEHKELAKDFKDLFINFTPLSPIVATYLFLHKWLVKKKSIQRAFKIR